MPCYQVQTGEKLLHTEEINKVSRKPITVDQIQDLQRTFWDKLQNLNKVCRVDRWDQCWLPDFDSKYLNMQESNLTKRLPPIHFLALWHNRIKLAICWSLSDFSYLQALHHERIEGMRWCVDAENENGLSTRKRMSRWTGKGAKDHEGTQHSREPHEHCQRQLCHPVLDLRSKEISKSHEGNKAGLTPAVSVTCCQETKILVVMSLKTLWELEAQHSRALDTCTRPWASLSEA